MSTDPDLPIDGVQQSLFEEDYLRRTHGDVVRVPDVALTELVANAWDAGAARVAITIPSARSEALEVVDDGCGLTASLFSQRWMKLGYNRQLHQGANAEFPPERSDRQRRAFGRNGQGRHALLCFGDSYEVETWRDGTAVAFRVTTGGGVHPFLASRLWAKGRGGHGTKLRVIVERHLPDPERIRELLATKFLHDPSFDVSVNGLSVPVADLPGVIVERSLVVEPGVELNLICVDGEPGRTKHQSGVAFWVGGRLVGEPGWVVGHEQVLDGRTRPGRRLTFVVRSDDLFDEVFPDWTGFRSSERMSHVFGTVRAAVDDVLREVLRERVGETRRAALSRSRASLRELMPGERLEVAEIVESVTEANPLTDAGALATVVDHVVEVKRRRSAEALVERIMSLPPEDVDALHRLLDEWTARDALTVLDEIGRRIKVVEALEKVMGDASVSELQVLHPLVTRARWLFGPEFESPEFASNVSIRNAVKQVFGESRPPEAFENPRVRPDLLFLPESTLSVVATEEIDGTNGVPRLRQVVLIELKRGSSTIDRAAMNQAVGYVEDLLHCGLLDGAPYVTGFVVGHKVEPKMMRVRPLGDPVVGRVEAMTFGQMIRAANRRLFRVRDQVQERYPVVGGELLRWLNERPEQLDLLGLQPRSDSDESPGSPN